MKWKNTAFKFKDIADLTKKELDEAGIKTDAVFHTGEGYWYVPWMVMSEEQEQIALHIICQHIW